MLELALQLVGALVAVLALLLEVSEPGRKKRWIAISAMSLVAVGAGLGAKTKFDEERSKREFALLYDNDAVARQQDVEDTRTQLWELLDSNKNIPDRLKPMLEVVATFIVSEEKRDLRRATKTLEERVDASSGVVTKKVDEKLTASSTAMTKVVDEKLTASSAAMTKAVDEKLTAQALQLERLEAKLAELTKGAPRDAAGAAVGNEPRAATPGAVISDVEASASAERTRATQDNQPASTN